MRQHNPGKIERHEAAEPTIIEKHHRTEEHHHHYLPATKKRREELAVIAAWVWRAILLALVLWLALRSAHAQQAPLNFDAQGNLNVNVAAGGGAGGTSSTFGGSFPGTGTAAGFKDGGGLMQPGLLDASGFLKMDCAAGCAGAADNSASGTLNTGSGAGNTLAIALAGDNSVSVTLPAGNTLVGTIVAEYSSDNQTTWQATNLRAPGAQWVANVALSSTQNTYNIQAPGGASHVRVRLSAYTSGSAAAVMRAVGQPELVTGSSGIAGSAIPPYLLVVGGSDGTNARAISVDTSGRPNVNVIGTVPISAASLPLPTGAATAAKQPALGTAGTPSADVITVQGVTSMTPIKTDGSGVTQPVSAAALPLPTGAAADSSVTGLEVGQGSTTSGQKGPLVQCAVTTAAPTYTTGQTNPCSLTTSGALRIDGSGVTQPVSGTVTANQGGTWSDRILGNAGATLDGTQATPATQALSEILLPSSSSTAGLSMFDNAGTSVTTVVSVKASAGNLYGYFIGNTNATVCYLQIFNVASGSVTLGTTAPNLTLPIPATSGANISLALPISFGTAISLASTTTATGATTTGCGQTVNVWYQ